MTAPIRYKRQEARQQPQQVRNNMLSPIKYPHVRKPNIFEQASIDMDIYMKNSLRDVWQTIKITKENLFTD